VRDLGGRTALTKSTAPASAINNSYLPFFLKDLWIKFGVAPQAADSKHLFHCASLRGNTGSISTLTQDGASPFTTQGALKRERGHAQPPSESP
jgi:hypothetical protein